MLPCFKNKTIVWLFSKFPLILNLIKSYCVIETVMDENSYDGRVLDHFKQFNCSQFTWNMLKILCLFYVSIWQEKDPVYWVRAKCLTVVRYLSQGFITFQKKLVWPENFFLNFPVLPLPSPYLCSTKKKKLVKIRFVPSKVFPLQYLCNLFLSWGMDSSELHELWF